MGPHGGKKRFKRSGKKMNKDTKEGKRKGRTQTVNFQTKKTAQKGNHRVKRPGNITKGKTEKEK